MDHRGDFTVLVQTRLGAEAAKDVDWSSPRLVCVASDFTRYDEHAIAQMGRSIELVRYRDFEGGGFLALDLVASTAGQKQGVINAGTPSEVKKKGKASTYATVTQLYEKSPDVLRNLYSDLDAHLTTLGDDVTMTTRKFYFAYRRIKNFACVEVHPQSCELLVYVKVDPDSIELVDGFTRDVRQIGHFGTGDLEIRIKNADGLERATPLIQTSYDVS